jgi:hypothetical protein
MLFYRKRLLRIAQLWFDDPLPSAGADVVVFNQAPVPGAVGTWHKKMTLIIDLSKSEKVLMEEMNSKDRAKIRNAQNKDDIVCIINEEPDPEWRNRFYAFYDRFAAVKGLSRLDRTLMEQAALQGQLTLSCAWQGTEDAPGDPLVFHALLVYGGRARALYSGSMRLEEHDPDQLNLIGRANRLLHWEEIRRFRASGKRLYDFGGWYAGTEDTQRLGINRFKAGFGGRVITEYEGIQGITLRGKLGVFLWQRLKGH